MVYNLKYCISDTAIDLLIYAAIFIEWRVLTIIKKCVYIKLKNRNMPFTKLVLSNSVRLVKEIKGHTNRHGLGERGRVGNNPNSASLTQSGKINYIH